MCGQRSKDSPGYRENLASEDPVCIDIPEPNHGRVFGRKSFVLFSP